MYFNFSQDLGSGRYAGDSLSTLPGSSVSLPGLFSYFLYGLSRILDAFLVLPPSFIPDYEFSLSHELYPLFQLAYFIPFQCLFLYLVLVIIEEIL